MKRRDINTFYADTGITRYFLQPLPQWANASLSGACWRKSTIFFMNLDRLTSSFDLSNHDSIQFQLAYNIEAQRKLREVRGMIADSQAGVANVDSGRAYSDTSGRSFLPLGVRERLFFQVFEHIQAKIYPFKAPKYPKVNILWIDPALNDARVRKKLRRFIFSQRGQSRPNVYLSFCLSKTEMEALSQEWKLGDEMRLLLPSQLLAPYDAQRRPTTSLQIRLQDLFRKNQKLFFYAPRGKDLPSNIVDLKSLKVDRY